MNAVLNMIILIILTSSWQVEYWTLFYLTAFRDVVLSDQNITEILKIILDRGMSFRDGNFIFLPDSITDRQMTGLGDHEGLDDLVKVKDANHKNMNQNQALRYLLLNHVVFP